MAQSSGTQHAGRTPPTDGDGRSQGSLDKSKQEREEILSWATIPRKGQLAILAFSRVVDFFQVASLQTYMVYQLKSFQKSQSDSTIAVQAGILQGAFTGAQAFSAVGWGRFADIYGRKTTLLIGLVGTAVSCTGLAFATTFVHAVMWRLQAGAVNGMVGAARTMCAETVHKKWHSRAFLLFSLAYNVANVLGPVVGGLLSDPVINHPSLFGENSLFGGPPGAQWLRHYPFALVNLISAFVLVVETFVVFLWLHETLDDKRQLRDLGLEMRRKVWTWMHLRRKNITIEYSALDSNGDDAALLDESFELENDTEDSQRHGDGPPITPPSRPRQRLPFSRIWTPNVLFTLVGLALFESHLAAFSNLWLLFLSTARSTIYHSPISFAGGLGFPASSVGAAMAILGALGVILQLGLYPPINARFGFMRCYRAALALFPVAYFFAPYLSLLPSSSPIATPPALSVPATGPALWTGITLIALLQVIARLFAMPAAIILLTDCSPHPSVLGTIHGVGQSVSSVFKTLGPIATGYLHAHGLQITMIALPWWVIAAASLVGFAVSFKMYDGTGHEIFLPGEEEEAEEEEEEQGVRRAMK